MKAREVLKNVEWYIAQEESRKKAGYSTGLWINAVYDNLCIFDWWNDYLSLTNLKQMRSFLKKAIALGFEGYACFKVGASGCANGMWVHMEESDERCSPDGACLYRSFTPDYTRWSINLGKEWERPQFRNTKDMYEHLIDKYAAATDAAATTAKPYTISDRCDTLKYNTMDEMMKDIIYSLVEIGKAGDFDEE